MGLRSRKIKFRAYRKLKSLEKMRVNSENVVLKTPLVNDCYEIQVRHDLNNELGLNILRLTLNYMNVVSISNVFNVSNKLNLITGLIDAVDKYRYALVHVPKVEVKINSCREIVLYRQSEVIIRQNFLNVVSTFFYFYIIFILTLSGKALKRCKLATQECIKILLKPFKHSDIKIYPMLTMVMIRNKEFGCNLNEKVITKLE